MLDSMLLAITLAPTWVAIKSYANGLHSTLAASDLSRCIS